MNTKSMKYLFSFVVALWASALSAQSHWSVNPSDFSGHMTIYYGLKSGDHVLSDISNYEVAAFVNGECRGVGTIENHDGKTYGQLLVYGNTDGEYVSFKFYNKNTQEEKNIYDVKITFSTDGIVGYPSDPQMFDVSSDNVLLGDADGDGVVDLTDAVAIFEYFMTGSYPNFNETAADFDQDGTVDLTDAVLVFEYYMNQ